MCCRELRGAVEILIDTGRRPDETCRLDLDCLTRRVKQVRLREAVDKVTQMQFDRHGGLVRGVR
ncbi:hypothetical protein ACTVZO_00805 [Streptomyces sp. IBSNAI002]|uniref:hypothetical protein n=1 Tax=Streptomyces sp. IBSNAI002 TaxID=3457500 RepID=UPI003FD0175C